MTCSVVLAALRPGLLPCLTNYKFKLHKCAKRYVRVSQPVGHGRIYNGPRADIIVIE